MLIFAEFSLFICKTDVGNSFFTVSRIADVRDSK